MAKLTLDGIEYDLKLNFNAICAFEKATGKGFIFFQNNLAQNGALSLEFNDIRALLWAGLIWKRDMTIEQAGNLITGDNIAEILTATSEAITEAFPSKIPDKPDTDKKKVSS